jgi:hypothetical protein
MLSHQLGTSDLLRDNSPSTRNYFRSGLQLRENQFMTSRKTANINAKKIFNSKSGLIGNRRSKKSEVLFIARNMCLHVRGTLAPLYVIYLVPSSRLCCKSEAPTYETVNGLPFIVMYKSYSLRSLNLEFTNELINANSQSRRLHLRPRAYYF